MTSQIAAIAIDAIEPRPIAEFWAAVLGWQIVEEHADGLTIAPKDTGWPTIDVFQVPERKSIKNRLHIDVRPDGVTAAEEVRRLLALGARPADVGQGPDTPWTVLADPEGNEFCVLARSVQDLAGS
jgi:Glyoxalase-like domain